MLLILLPLFYYFKGEKASEAQKKMWCDLSDKKGVVNAVEFFLRKVLYNAGGLKFLYEAVLFFTLKG